MAEYIIMGFGFAIGISLFLLILAIIYLILHGGYRLSCWIDKKQKAKKEAADERSGQDDLR